VATALTETWISATVAAFDGRRLEIGDRNEPGLRLRIGEASAKWSVMTRGPGGEKARLPLGSWPGVSLDRARSLARAFKRTFAGAAEEELDELAVVTLLERYRARRLSQLRKGDVIGRALEVTLDPLKHRSAAELTRREIGVVIDDLAERAPIHANRVLAYMKAFFNWAVGRGYIETNPAATISKPTRERTRDRTPSLTEVADIWLGADALGYPFGPIVKLLVLTAARREEVGSMRVAEVIDAATGKVADCWTLPAERSKNGRALRVPLSAPARKVIEAALKKRPRRSLFVFSTNGTSTVSGWSRAKQRLDGAIAASRTKRKADPLEPWRFHDLRRSFATHACDVLHVDPIVADRCLNHVGASTTSTVARVYSRNELFDQRRDALTAWAGLVEKAVTERSASAPKKAAGNFRRRRERKKKAE
jgi:integrase